MPPLREPLLREPLPVLEPDPELRSPLLLPERPEPEPPDLEPELLDSERLVPLLPDAELLEPDPEPLASDLPELPESLLLPELSRPPLPCVPAPSSRPGRDS